MRIAVDTNRITDLFRGDAAFAELLGTADEIWIPFIVLGELRAGFLGGTQHKGNDALLSALLSKPTVDVLLPSRETAEHYGRLFVQLKRAGTPIPDNDLWIAALVLQHDLALCSRDGHFDRIPQLLRG